MLSYLKVFLCPVRHIVQGRKGHMGTPYVSQTEAGLFASCQSLKLTSQAQMKYCAYAGLPENTSSSEKATDRGVCIG